MKKSKIFGICALLIAMIILSGCNIAQITENITLADKLLPKTTDNDLTARTFEKAAENEKMELLYNKNTAEIAVREKLSDIVWYSNPQNLSADTKSSEENRQKQASQFTLAYSDKQGVLREMNSFSDSVKRGQYKIEKIDDGLKITYTLGNVEERKLVPEIVSQDKFEKKVLDKITAEQREKIEKRYMLIDLSKITDDKYRKELETRYPSSRKKPVYVLRNNPPPPNFVREINEILSSSEYTFDDLNTDSLENGVTPPPEEPLFTISVYYTITNDFFKVRVPETEIKMSAAFLLERLSLLEFFGAAGTDAKGYILLPDGSGSLLYLNNGKSAMKNYYCDIYGIDNSLYEKEKIYNTEQANLPVFGLKNGNQAFFAIIEDGDAIAAVKAMPSGGVSAFNSVNAEFKIREKLQVNLGDKNHFKNIYQVSRYAGDLKISYKFLNGAEANYVGMAKFYSNYLFGERKEIKRQSVPLYIETIGLIDSIGSFAGIPREEKISLTTFEQTKDISSDLKSSGVKNLIIRLSGWFNGGLRQLYPATIKIENSLGGKSGLEKLSIYLKENDVGLFPDVDMQYNYRDGMLDGFDSKKDAARFINKAPAMIYGYNPATFNYDNINGNPFYIITPWNYSKLCDSFLNAFNNLDINGLSLKNAGQDINSDFYEQKMMDRQQASKEITSMLKKIKDEGYSVMLTNGNAMTLPYTKHILNIPFDYCGYDITDESIPFFEIVISGHMNYTGKPLNLNISDQRIFLKTIETGAGLYYVVSQAESTKLKKTGYDKFYSVCYADWKEEIKKTYNELDSIFKDRSCSEIIDHTKLAEDVYQTDFENGLSVYVNYGLKDYMAGSVNVPTLGYAVKRMGS